MSESTTNENKIDEEFQKCLEENEREYRTKIEKISLKYFTEYYKNFAFDKCDELLTKVINGNIDYFNETFLNEAASNANYDQWKWLLESGVSPDTRYRYDGNSWTMLMQAADADEYEICELLIDHKASINARSLKSKCTALMFAVDNDNVNICTLFLDNGANVDIVDSNGNSAISGENEASKYLKVQTA